ncbi:hypothetical protein [Methylomonas koyamae]|uniref:hypothetical protein n=1 Tax=Methylomonas koyamae TaxID=702114 RepID=UPI00112BD660|nr:hypothetical protein [Methylomonas koyamae]
MEKFPQNQRICRKKPLGRNQHQWLTLLCFARNLFLAPKMERVFKFQQSAKWVYKKYFQPGAYATFCGFLTKNEKSPGFAGETAKV